MSIRVKFDNLNFIEDLKNIVNDAKGMETSLIVVPTEREVKTLERNFGDDCHINGICYCTFADFASFKWISMFGERPKKIFIFRIDDLVKTYSADADIVYLTVAGKKNYKKEENINEV